MGDKLTISDHTRLPTVTRSVVNADSKIDLHTTLDILQHIWTFNLLKRHHLYARVYFHFAIPVHIRQTNNIRGLYS